MNQMEVNAALWNLVNGEKIEESAAIVIEFGQTLKKSNPFFFFRAAMHSTESESFTGHTDAGDVTIRDEKEAVREFSTIHKTRVGHFKVWRRGADEIWFQHFWKADLATNPNQSGSDQYRILFDHRTNELKHFGILRTFSFPRRSPIRFAALFVESIDGSNRELVDIVLRVGMMDEP